MNEVILGLLRELAHYQSHLATEQQRLAWKKAAQEVVDDATGHLGKPPKICPVCGAPVYPEYNAHYHVIVVKCACSYEDEWDEPDPAHPASIRY